jgi:hypothetical protein
VSSLALVPPPRGGVYRITLRAYEAFSPPPWEIAKTPDGHFGTFGNRFDDPRDDLDPSERYRCIYAASTPQAAFGEVLRRLVPSPNVIRGMEEIEDDEESLEDALGNVLDPLAFQSQREIHHLVPAQWRLARQIGHAFLSEQLRFVDLNDPRTVAYLGHTLRIELDLSHLTSGNRSLTQRIARLIWDFGEIGGHSIGGLRYMSRLGAEWECWALFDNRLVERLTLDYPRDIASDDSDLLAVAQIFGLTIEPLSGHRIYERPWRTEVPDT